MRSGDPTLDRQWQFALECFERCTTSVFQPSQLFPLFPKHTKKWAEQVCVEKPSKHKEVDDGLLSYAGVLKILLGTACRAYGLKIPCHASTKYPIHIPSPSTNSWPCVGDESDRMDMESGTSGRDMPEEKAAQAHIATYLLKVRRRQWIALCAIGRLFDDTRFETGRMSTALKEWTP